MRVPMNRQAVGWTAAVVLLAGAGSVAQSPSDCQSRWKATADKQLGYRERSDGTPRCEGLVVTPNAAAIAVRSVRQEAALNNVGGEFVLRPAAMPPGSRLNIAVEGLDVNYRLDMRERPAADMFKWPVAVARQAVAGARALTADDLKRFGVLVRPVGAAPDEYVAAALTADASTPPARTLYLRIDVLNAQPIAVTVKPALAQPIPRLLPRSTMSNTYFVELRVPLPRPDTYVFTFQTTTAPVKTLGQVKVLM